MFFASRQVTLSPYQSCFISTSSDVFLARNRILIYDKAFFSSPFCTISDPRIRSPCHSSTRSATRVLSAVGAITACRHRSYQRRHHRHLHRRHATLDFLPRLYPRGTSPRHFLLISHAASLAEARRVGILYASQPPRAYSRRLTLLPSITRV